MTYSRFVLTRGGLAYACPPHFRMPRIARERELAVWLLARLNSGVGAPAANPRFRTLIVFDPPPRS